MSDAATALLAGHARVAMAEATWSTLEARVAGVRTDPVESAGMREKDDLDLTDLDQRRWPAPRTTRR